MGKQVRGGRIFRVGVSIDPTAPYKMYSGSVRSRQLTFKMPWVGHVRSSLPTLMHVGSIATPFSDNY